MSRFPSGPRPPRRVRGVRPERRISVAPAPPMEAPTEDTAELKFNRWNARWAGTYPEFLVFEYLEEEVNLAVDIDFKFQSSQMGGRQVAGGSVVDFEIYTHKVFIRVQGLFFHVGDPELEGADIMTQLAIETATGWTVVNVFEDDLYERRDYTVAQALLGRQITHLGEAP